ncbi:MAG: hypothetical protein EAZ55_08715 [Cytophagales bacterium]|nr:MAG: hypothetical protein EAZ55_08715 [Cytophagales bacterium]
MIVYVWHPTTSNMTNTDYQNEHLQIVKFSEMHQIAKHLIDTRNFTFTIGLEMQEWANQNFYPPLMASGSRKFSLVIPSDLFAQVSIEQTVEDSGTADVVQTRYFDDIEKARAWALED